MNFKGKKYKLYDQSDFTQDHIISAVKRHICNSETGVYGIITRAVYSCNILIFIRDVFFSVFVIPGVFLIYNIPNLGTCALAFKKH